MFARPLGTQPLRLLAITVVACGAALSTGCPWLNIPGLDAILGGQVIDQEGADQQQEEESEGIEVFNNTTDPTNNGARYIGSRACSACHPSVFDKHYLHGHAWKLNPVFGGPPEFPDEADRAGVPNPPDGFDWDDVAYVIGGYTRKGRFVDLDGFILITGIEGVNTQWNLDFPPNGTQAGWVPYDADRTDPKPYGWSCFVCHTTGPMEQDPDNPLFQDNRPGLVGTWQETGIQCEACHGPGSNHIPNPSARDIYVDTSAELCGRCHTRPYGSDGSVILASGGYIRHHEQWPELLASGGHANFECVTCHDPHAGTAYDRDRAIRNECTACHPDQNMAFHEGKTFVRGSYRETLTCESCHMPFATKSASKAGEDIVGPIGRMGDIRTHIFRINTDPVDYTAMFTDDGSEVVKDAQGRAAVTVDFVCFRCHNGIGNAFELSSIEAAAEIAFGMHGG